MKVGDLVTKQSPLHKRLVGVIVAVEDGCSTGKLYKVYWSDYGTFWSLADKVEIVNESR